MKKRILGENQQQETSQKVEIKKENSKSRIKDPININKNNENNQKTEPNIKINKTKKSQNQKYTPIKTVSNKINNKPKNKNDLIQK